MTRRFWLWGKKRGSRRSGSPLLSGIAEAMLFAALLLFGTISLAALVTFQLIQPSGEGIPGWVWILVLVVSSVCTLVGGWGIVSTALRLRTSAERRSALAHVATTRVELLNNEPATEKEYPSIPKDTDLTNSPGVRLRYRLPIAASPISSFFTLTGLWLLSVGIASITVVWANEGFRQELTQTYRLYIAAPLTIIAIASTYWFVKALLVQITLGPTTVEISDHPLLPTEVYKVFVSQAGHLTFKNLQLRLVCQEEATYEQGTNVRTECNSVCSQQIFRLSNLEVLPGSPFEHECEMEIPSEAMHTFQAPSNRINWKLVVRGSIEGWPDFERSFPIVVYPCIPSSIATSSSRSSA